MYNLENENKNSVCNVLSNIEYIEKVKLLETQLSNQETLHHFTQIKMNKIDEEYTKCSADNKKLNAKINALLREISSLSKNNSQLMEYCETKVSGCRLEYDKKQKQYLHLMNSHQISQQNVAVLKTQLKNENFYKKECTKFRAMISTLKSNLKTATLKYQKIQEQLRTAKNMTETQNSRLSQNSQNISHLNKEVINFKNEIRKHKINNMQFSLNFKCLTKVMCFKIC